MVHIIFLIALFFVVPEINRKYPFRIFTFAILFLFLALRYDYGNDYMSYYNIHTAINSGLPSWGQNDILFKQLNLLVSNYFVFIGVTSLFYISVIYYLIKHNLKVKQYWISVWILLINPYLLLSHSSGMRQTLAMAFFIIAVNFAVKRNPLFYVFFTMLAVGMHASAIILLPIYFVLTEKEITKKMMFVIFGSLIILVFTPFFDITAYKILEYLPSHYVGILEQGIQNSYRATLISSFYFFLVIFNINKLKGKEIIYGKLYLIGTAIVLLAIKVSMINRIAIYFNVFSIIAIPLIFDKIESKIYKKILIVITFTIYILRYLSFFMNPLWESFREYKTILGM